MASYIQKNKASKILNLTVDFRWFTLFLTLFCFLFMILGSTVPFRNLLWENSGPSPKKNTHSRFCILAHPWTWTLSYRPLVNIARHGCIIEPGSNMIKSISSVSEHWQECGECVGSDESHVRGNKTLLQCFSQEMKVCTVVPANICF